ncbi:MAG: dienelactone hydrolase family protein [Verrucomicrobia bacterium]|nr:dienelactone hydrolase family protein [Verrucomicrobiota bacterium]
MTNKTNPIPVHINRSDPRRFTHVTTRPPKPRLVTPFDDLLRGANGKPIRTPRLWQARRKKILAAFRATLGVFPSQHAALGARVIARERLEHFERRKVEIRVHADEVATAYLCIPRRPLPSHPAVLCLPQTHQRAHEIMAGFDGRSPDAYGARLADAGFVTLCPDHFVSGERTPKDGPFVTAEFYRRHPRWSAVGKAIWDNQRCLDYLESLPCVNARRIGCMGHSLGAHSALFLAALDERVQCVVSNCGISSFRCNPNRCHWSRDGWYVYFPSLRALFLKGKPAPFDFHELGASLAPRPWLDISSLNDPTFDGAEHLPGMFIRITEVYRLMGASNRFSFFTHGEPHGMFEHSCALAESWLRQWLAA